MNLSDLATADREVRRQRRAISLEQSIRRRLQWHYKHSAKEIRQVHVARAGRAINALQAYANGYATGYIDPPCEINTSLSSRAISKISAKDLLGWIFTGLPQPTKAQHTDLEQMIIDNMNKLS